MFNGDCGSISASYRRITLQAFLLTTILVTLMACDRDESGRDVPEIMTTDGIRTIRYHSPRPGSEDPLTWERGTVYASEQEESTYLLSFIAGVEVTAEGEVLIWGPRSEAIYRFASDGAYLGSIGRHGAGPGEFTSIYGVLPLPEGIGVLDPVGRRLVVFGADGQFIEQQTLPEIVPAMPSGLTLALAVGEGFTAGLIQGRGGSTSGYVHLMNWRFRILRLSPGMTDGQAVFDTTYAVPWVAAAGKLLNPVAARADRVAFAVGPYTPFAWSDRDELRIDFLDPNTGARWAVELPGGQFPVTRRMRESIREELAGDVLPEEIVARLDIPDRLPAVGNLDWDRAGRLWMETFRSVFYQWYGDGQEAREYLVFDSDGRFLFYQNLPFTPLLITADAFYVREELADGTPVIVRYGYLERP